jgi:hypothetical protein
MMFLFDDTCKVVNRSKDIYDVYIGRPSIFQNPYVIGRDGTREDVIEKFKSYFIDKIKTDKDFKFKVDRLKGKVLGCHCKPKDCHGDIIKAYIEGKLKIEMPKND